MHDPAVHAAASEARPQPAVVGVVVIGRNEGERLKRCLRSLGEQVRQTVYVDSGSTDDSVTFARGLGATVVDLDTSVPFTAARARNEGFRALESVSGAALEFVQFVDGDCEVESGWIARAVQELRSASAVAVVFGRRRERERRASPYNRVCDLEWDVPAGDVLSCGGDMMIRAEALRSVGGYDPRLIAGEEPDLCLRLRERGWRVRSIGAPMTIHDAALHRFGQWWRRAVRAGYVEAEGIADRGLAYPRRRWVWSNLFWVVLVPASTLAAATVAIRGGSWSGAAVAIAVAVGLHLVSWLRIVSSARRRWQADDAALYASFCLLARWAAMQGMLVYWWRRLRRSERRLIEYKDTRPA